MGQISEAFTNRFGGQLWYAMPDGRFIYSRHGHDYNLDETIADPEAVMKASLEQKKNFVITAFPVVDLYPDPNCVY